MKSTCGMMKSTCGMRRFDKHRMEVLHKDNGDKGGEWSAEQRERLRQREEQDRMLFGGGSPPALPVSLPAVPAVPATEASGYTPWKTPSACGAGSGKPL